MTQRRSQPEIGEEKFFSQAASGQQSSSKFGRGEREGLDEKFTASSGFYSVCGQRGEDLRPRCGSYGEVSSFEKATKVVVSSEGRPFLDLAAASLVRDNCAIYDLAPSTRSHIEGGQLCKSAPKPRSANQGVNRRTELIDRKQSWKSQENVRFFTVCSRIPEFMTTAIGQQDGRFLLTPNGHRDQANICFLRGKRHKKINLTSRTMKILFVRQLVYKNSPHRSLCRFRLILSLSLKWQFLSKIPSKSLQTVLRFQRSRIRLGCLAQMLSVKENRDGYSGFSHG